MLGAVIQTAPLLLIIVFMALVSIAKSFFPTLILLFGSIGVVFLLAAKWRLLKEKNFTSFGFSRLNSKEKKLYFAAYFFVGMSVVIAVYSLTLPQQWANRIDSVPKSIWSSSSYNRMTTKAQAILMSKYPILQMRISKYYRKLFNPKDPVLQNDPRRKSVALN